MTKFFLFSISYFILPSLFQDCKMQDIVKLCLAPIAVMKILSFLDDKKLTVDMNITKETGPRVRRAGLIIYRQKGERTRRPTPTTTFLMTVNYDKICHRLDHLQSTGWCSGVQCSPGLSRLVFTCRERSYIHVTCCRCIQSMVYSPVEANIQPGLFDVQNFFLQSTNEIKSNCDKLRSVKPYRLIQTTLELIFFQMPGVQWSGCCYSQVTHHTGGPHRGGWSRTARQS